MDYGGEHRHQYKGAFVVITNPFVPEKLKQRFAAVTQASFE